MKTKLFFQYAVYLLVVIVLFAGCNSAESHPGNNRTDCKTCHSQTGIEPFPKSHEKNAKKYSNCTNCHDIHKEKKEDK